MTIHMMHVFAYIERFLGPSNATVAGEGGAALAVSPLLGLIGLCLISLLILGGLWLKGPHRTHGFRRSLSKERLPEVEAYDHVTGLPTRRLFETLLEQSVSRAAKTGRPLALLVVELEHFRMVAESQGLANSNVLVRVQAARVKGVLRSTGTVARLTQDQFAMIADNLTSHEELTAIVDKLQATVGLPLTLDGHELFLTCRIGVTLYPQDARDHTGLIEQAMLAVKIAKSNGQVVRFASPTVYFAVPEPMPLVS